MQKQGSVSDIGKGIAKDVNLCILQQQQQKEPKDSILTIESMGGYKQVSTILKDNLAHVLIIKLNSLYLQRDHKSQHLRGRRGLKNILVYFHHLTKEKSKAQFDRERLSLYSSLAVKLELEAGSPEFQRIWVACCLGTLAQKSGITFTCLVCSLQMIQT